MKYIKYLVPFALLLFLAACTAGESGTGEVPEVVEADVQLPVKMNPGEDYQLQVEVTQGGEPVEDADEVLFEMWNDSEGGGSSRVEAKHIGEGIYQVDENFEITGVYSVQTHITARGMHVMPKRQFQVGDVTEEQIENAKENAQNQKSTHMDDHGDDSHHH